MLNRLKNIKSPIKCPNVRLAISRNNNLALNFQNGDINSFSTIYSKFHKPILKFVNKQVKVVHVAEELTQDIFLKVYQSRSSFNPEFQLSTWIWTIARNTVYDHLRKIKTSAINDPQSTIELTDSDLSSTETAESIIIEEFEKVKLLTLMTSLSEKQKEAIFLRMVKKFSYLEISKSMNLSLSAVKSLINRGKSALMKLNSEPNTT